MTKKDYIAFAEMLKQKEPVESKERTRSEFLALHALWRVTVLATADIFQADNRAFDREKFAKAAGLT